MGADLGGSTSLGFKRQLSQCQRAFSRRPCTKNFCNWQPLRPRGAALYENSCATPLAGSFYAVQIAAIHEGGKRSVARDNTIALTAEIVSAYATANKLKSTDLASLINQVHCALYRAATGTVEAVPEVLTPAVHVKKSVLANHIVCLEDGLKFKSLKRHLRTSYNLTPDEYRAKWSLPTDYPMVAPNYAKARSAIAKKAGFGRKE